MIKVSKFGIMVALLLSFILLILPSVLRGQETAAEGATVGVFSKFQDFWLFRLLLNLIGYATIIVPGYFLIQYLKKIKYNERQAKGCIPKTVGMCVFGTEADKNDLAEEGGQTASAPPKPEWSTSQKALRLLFCFIGLQASYLTWGLLQERIMTHDYGKSDTEEGEKFTNSQFLVFMNRILAFITAVIICLLTKQPFHTAPLYKYSYCSFSNIMSSWCQYEALKFVSFPTQVLAKSCKVIPVMIMGKFTSNKSYKFHEYGTALLISSGVSIFLLTSSEDKHPETGTTFSGLFILISYLMFDSFTSNWQGELFSTFKMSSMQMMAGVNLFSCLFTTVSLIEQGGFVESLAFMGKYPTFFLHVCLLSVCSASGQLFIFYTISNFGPVTFTIIMTIRMGLAILLSCLIYSHPVTLFGLLGISIVFGAVFLRTYLGQRDRKMKARQIAASAPIVKT
ncbi:unnamed protein product [Owenia fusiformis]|uniref:Adenosine 3'-phospho 5'-phosphosulfate transporter 1 n=1 Tax=Owenia fusiformis TaxID=6347 RepID=A0A8S4PGS4_OWEFU|nr:unnamed protein product [Owenia fusiformis]